VEAVVIADAALHMRLRLDRLEEWARSKIGHRGIHNLRRVLTLVDGNAESPMESRLRMVLVLAGLPRPRSQVSIHDRWGRFIGRCDLYYERERLGVEYDGGIHRNALVEDNRRQNKLLNAGVRLLRFTAADVFQNSDAVVAQVRAMLDDSTLNPPTAGSRL
jgi:very-short-patch-repair endonuclease